MGDEADRIIQDGFDSIALREKPLDFLRPDARVWVIQKNLVAPYRMSKVHLTGTEGRTVCGLKIPRRWDVPDGFDQPCKRCFR